LNHSEHLLDRRAIEDLLGSAFHDRASGDSDLTDELLSGFFFTWAAHSGSTEDPDSIPIELGISLVSRLPPAISSP
jgi:hypothetical protein